MNMKKIGKLKTYSSKEIKLSPISIGFECLDRELFNPEMCYDLIAKTGVKHARCQTGWARCEKQKGVYDFRWLDSIVDNLILCGLTPWFNVGFGNPIYMPNLPNKTGVGCVPIYYGKEATEAWINFLKALTKHYQDKIEHYEIWNEPDVPDFWYPQKPNAIDYAKFVNISSTAIKTINPSAKIGISVATPYRFGFIKTTLDNLPEGSIDFFSYHTYTTIPECRYNQVVTFLRKCLDERGFTRTELWQGEAGYPSWAYKGHWLVREGCDDERAQAVWQLRRYFLDVYNGVKLSSFFQMADMWEKPYEKAVEVLNKPAAHGILNGRIYTPKKSYETISNLSTIFSEGVLPAKEYLYVDILEVETTTLLSCQTMTFIKNDNVFYAYYLPLKLGTSHDISQIANIYTSQTIENPILIDPYTSEVFELKKPDNIDGMFMHKNLPVKDYPLILADRGLFEIKDLII